MIHFPCSGCGRLYLSAFPARVIGVQHPWHRPDEWFTLEVEARDRHVVIRVNGLTTVERDLIDKEVRLRDHFALQQHDPATVVKFRKIEVKELPSAAGERR